jgi:GNAT superfamily N-acetyltransferase
VVVAYLDEVAVSCACFKKYDEQTIEIKRMFVMPEMRGNRLAPMMLEVLESWAHELGFSSAVLETLYKQNAAIKMYQNAGYAIIENYEPYVGLSASICMKKRI